MLLKNVLKAFRGQQSFHTCYHCVEWTAALNVIAMCSQVKIIVLRCTLQNYVDYGRISRRIAFVLLAGEVDQYSAELPEIRSEWYCDALTSMVSYMRWYVLCCLFYCHYSVAV